MQNFTTDAINLKTYPLSEADNIVVMLSKKGLIRGVARGVKRAKSKLGGSMQVLVANRLMLKKGRNLDTICQAQSINTFNKLRKDLDKLTYALYLSEIVEIFCSEDFDGETIFDNFYKTLENIANSENKTQILFNVLKFQLKFMKDLGLGIELENCIICGSYIAQNPYFSTRNGGIVCEKCINRFETDLKIPTKIRDFLSTVSTLPIDEKSSYDKLINEVVGEKCFKMMDKYIKIHSSRKIKSLEILQAV